MLAAFTLTLGSVTDTPVPANSLAAPLKTAASAPADTQSSVFRRPARPVERWMSDAPESRPAILPALYASYGAMQAFDIYSTRRALTSGAREANPAVRGATGNSATMMTVKALSTAGSIYFTERAWKKNRKGAIIMMAAMNGVTAAIAARNMHNAR
jgi:hypothetical protein